MSEAQSRPTRAPRSLPERRAADVPASRASRPWLAAVVASTALAAAGGCGAAAAGRSTVPRGDGSCVRVGGASSYTVLDRSRILIDDGVTYVLALDAGCQNLRFGDPALVFETRDGRVCDYRPETVRVGGEVCRVVAVSRYEPDADVNREIEDAIEQQSTEPD